MIKGCAIILGLAGIGVLLTGTLIHVGIILLIECGVLLTLVGKQPGRDRSA